MSWVRRTIQESKLRQSSSSSSRSGSLTSAARTASDPRLDLVDQDQDSSDEEVVGDDKNNLASTGRVEQDCDVSLSRFVVS